MQGKNTSDRKLNVPRSRKMSRSRPINVSVSSRTPDWTSRVSVSISWKMVRSRVVIRLLALL